MGAHCIRDAAERFESDVFDFQHFFRERGVMAARCVRDAEERFESDAFDLVSRKRKG